eukprot:TRINITY_DN17003_c0_g1_i3.p1 TRINITY_DN17003_c0_g1~~TRINITY_DN17003_c0_g1_i3.p1  ORF type:complete len:311 (+),score=16.01 TRINITY_DN17003_c0_g1_i3:36-968(+)
MGGEHFFTRVCQQMKRKQCEHQLQVDDHHVSSDPLALRVSQIAHKTEPEHESFHKHFPGSVEGANVEARVTHLLQERFGFNVYNTVCCQSFCPDEVNNKNPTDLSRMLHHRWGTSFSLGGLGGVPFTGKTGWGAFSAHVPKGGNAIVTFGPHVGIDGSGKVGQITRAGQDQPSTCCGAAVAAYNSLGKPFRNPDTYDMQQQTLERLLKEKGVHDEVRGNSMVALAYAMYDISAEFMRQVINTDFGGKIAILGGILVNLEEPAQDRFLPLVCEVYDPSNGGTVSDLLPVVVNAEEHVNGGKSTSLFPLPRS